jgi:hypothetical protein
VVVAGGAGAAEAAAGKPNVAATHEFSAVTGEVSYR